MTGFKAASRSAIFALFVNGAMRKGLSMLKDKAEGA